MDPRDKTVAQIKDALYTTSCARQKHLSRPATFARTVFAALALCVAQLYSACETAFNDLSRFGRTDLVELCCPEDSLLSKTVDELGGTVQRFGIHNGCAPQPAQGSGRRGPVS